MTHERIEQSPELFALYRKEHLAMLRVVNDPEAAREAARLNVSALLVGQRRLLEPGDRYFGRDLMEAIHRGGSDLGAIRRAVELVEKLRTRERPQPARERDVGRER